MAVLDILVAIGLVLAAITFVFLYIAMQRMKRNEPVWGWKRKQYLAEIQSGSVSSTTQNDSDEPIIDKRQQKAQEKIDKSHESISELMELKKIEHGIIERERNEFLIVLSTDFVNFSLLQPGERTAILEGYQQLYNVINFPIQLLGQAVRQDFSKDRQRFDKNLSRCNQHAQSYNRDVLNHIQSTTENDFRITLRIYYVVKFIYEPAKMAKLTKEQKVKHVVDSITLRAEVLRRALRRAKIDAEILDSVQAAEAIKRALNRDRMLIHPMEDVVQKEKLSPFVTIDFSTIPEFEQIVNNIEEALEIVGKPIEEKAFS